MIHAVFYTVLPCPEALFCLIVRHNTERRRKSRNPKPPTTGSLGFLFFRFIFFICIQSFDFILRRLHTQPVLKGLSGNADHVADANSLEETGVCQLIGRRAADAENGCNVIYGVSSVLGRPFFIRCVHNDLLFSIVILTKPAGFSIGKLALSNSPC